tara:strand:- start:572 stop:769 length:198 start_codon:yes stop_codon:yes gene_type:complete
MRANIETPKNYTFVIESIDKVFDTDRETYALGCLGVDVDTKKEIRVLLNFNYEELAHVVKTGVIL